MSQTIMIGEYEVTYAPQSEPALVLYHVVRGYDVARLSASAASELGVLLKVQQKRIRELAGHRALFGAAGDVSLYAPSGQRACYLNTEQAARLAHLLAMRDAA